MDDVEHERQLDDIIRENWTVKFTRDGYLVKKTCDWFPKPNHMQSLAQNETKT